MEKLKTVDLKNRPNVETLLGCGKFQGLIFICYQWTLVLQGCNMFFMAFGKVMPEHWTCWDERWSDDFDGNNSDNASQCTIIDTLNGCKNFTFSGEFYSIVPHWQLVCSRVKYIYLSLTLQMLGALFGAPIFGQLSDLYGRKWTLFCALLCIITFGTASAFAPTLPIFGALRFATGFGLGGCIIINHVFNMEFLIHKHRLWLSCVGGWCASYVLLVAVAYITADWRKLAIISNLCGIPSLALVAWIGESPRWLLERGKPAEAEKQFKRIARFNGVSFNEVDIALVFGECTSPLSNGCTENLPSYELEAMVEEPMLETDEDVRQPATVNKKYFYWHLFSTKSLAIYTVVLSITYFCISVIGYGITFNVDKLSGSIFINVSIMGGVRWVSNLTVICADWLIKRFGRRVGLIGPFVMFCTCSSVITMLQVFGSDLPQLQTTILALSMVMAMLSSPVWITIYLSNVELFPTPVRNMALAFCSTFNRLGGVAAPQVLYLAHFWKPAPFVVFAVLSLIACSFVAIFIPETKGKPLPEKMPETIS